MGEIKDLIIVKSYIKDIKYEIPKKAEELNKRTIKGIFNAVGYGLVDSKGFIWFDCSKLHTILRVKSKNDASYILEKVDNKYKANYNCKTYVIWSALMSIISKRVEKNPKNDKGYRKDKHHQFFTQDIGKPKLKEYLASVEALGRAANYNWNIFMELLDRAFPKQPQKIIDVEAEEIKEDSPNDEFDKGIDDILGYEPKED